ncbi:MAG: DoxX family protein [Reyranella sp.]|nr:DoxX family protein [Reyranella sp.]
MPQSRLTETAIFLLRVALGTMFIAHSLLLKLFVFTLPGTATFFASIGLPGWFAYLVFAAEAIGGIMLVLGIQARWAALALAPILAGATWAHSGNGWMFGYANGGWEYPLYLTLLAVVQFMLGDGAYALMPSKPIASTGVARPA